MMGFLPKIQFPIIQKIQEIIKNKVKYIKEEQFDDWLKFGVVIYEKNFQREGLYFHIYM